MKLDQLRNIIREEVRAAFKEELQEVLTEAVKIASTPQVKESNAYKPVPNTQPNVWSAASNQSKGTPLDEMLSMTSNEMTAEDYRSIGQFDSAQAKRPNFASSMASQMGMTPSGGPMPGIDLSQLDFVNKAKSIFDASVAKDKNRQVQ